MYRCVCVYVYCMCAYVHMCVYVCSVVTPSCVDFHFQVWLLPYLFTFVSHVYIVGCVFHVV